MLNVVYEECKVFSTKERTPFYICIELYRPDEESSSVVGGGSSSGNAQQKSSENEKIKSSRNSYPSLNEVDNKLSFPLTVQVSIRTLLSIQLLLYHSTLKNFLGEYGASNTRCNASIVPSSSLTNICSPTESGVGDLHDGINVMLLNSKIGEDKHVEEEDIQQQKQPSMTEQSNSLATRDKRHSASGRKKSSENKVDLVQEYIRRVSFEKNPSIQGAGGVHASKDH